MRALPDVLFAAAIVLAMLTWLWRFVWSTAPGARRARSPLWAGFTATAAAGLLLGAGGLGFHLDRHARFVSGTAWADGVIWWEVVLGLVLLPAAFVLVRRGIRDLHDEVRRQRTAVTRAP